MHPPPSSSLPPSSLIPPDFTAGVSSSKSRIPEWSRLSFYASQLEVSTYGCAQLLRSLSLPTLSPHPFSMSLCLSVSLSLFILSLSVSVSLPSLSPVSLSLSPFSRSPSLSPPLFLFPPPVLFFTSLFSVITSITHFGLFLKPLYFTYRYPASTLYIYILFTKLLSLHLYSSIIPLTYTEYLLCYYNHRNSSSWITEMCTWKRILFFFFFLNLCLLFILCIIMIMYAYSCLLFTLCMLIIAWCQFTLFCGKSCLHVCFFLFFRSFSFMKPITFLFR